MEDKYWENCPYGGSRDCPQSESIDRACLILHLVHKSDIETIKQICRECGKHLDEKRRYPRIRRPLRITLLRGRESAIEGDIINISDGGALVQMKSSADIGANERLIIEICLSHPASEKSPTSVTRLAARVKRVDAESRQLALIFLNEMDS